MGTTTRRNFLRIASLAAGSGVVSAVPLQRKRPPNILFLLSDQHRYDWMGSTANLGVRTPNIDQIAARGVRLTRAQVPSPLSGSAHACLASGRDYGHCGVRSNEQDFPLEQPTYFQ